MTDVAHDFKRLLHLIRTSDRCLLVSHQKPDGDTLGATLGLANWMIREGKNPVLFCVNEPSPSYRYLPNVHLYTNETNVFDEDYDLVIVLDSGSLEYAGIATHVPRLSKGHTMVAIDHHASNAGYADINIIMPHMSSTSEIIFHVLKTEGEMMDAAISTCLLTGLCTDTRNFSNPLTSASALEAGAALIAHGARFNDILRYYWKNQPIDALMLWGKLLSRLRYESTFSIATTYLTATELEGTPAELTEQMINFLAGVIGEADTVLLLKEHSNGTVSGSFRSHRRSVAKLAGFLGGGGHAGAAAFRLQAKLEILEHDQARIVPLAD